jgi:hypothetical protein
METEPAVGRAPMEPEQAAVRRARDDKRRVLTGTSLIYAGRTENAPCWSTAAAPSILTADPA